MPVIEVLTKRRLTSADVRRLDAAARFGQLATRTLRARLRAMTNAWLETIFYNISRHGLLKAKRPVVDYGVFNSAEAEKRMQATLISGSKAIYDDVWNYPAAKMVPVSSVYVDRKMLALDFARKKNYEFAGYAKTTSNRIVAMLSDELQAAQNGIRPSKEAKQRIAERFTQLTAKRIDNIARNIGQTAYEAARNDLWEKVNPAGMVKKKLWLGSVGGDHDRTWHNKIASVGAGEKFVFEGLYGNVSMDYPKADYASYPEECINCMCTCHYDTGD